MRDEDVVVAVAIPVGGGQSHRAAVVRHPGRVTDVLEPAAAVPIENVVRDVVGDVQVEPAVIVEVVPQGAQTPAFEVVDV